MARTEPDGWEALEQSGASPLEIATLRQLATELPDDFVVYHGIHWTRADQGYSVFGEIDFIVLGPNGQAVLIEQKNGTLEETPEGLFKLYLNRRKSVSMQVQRSLESLQFRFNQAHPGHRLALDYLVYCPDYRVQRAAIASIAPERIVDARNADKIASRISAVIAAMRPAEGVSPERIRNFLSDMLELAPDTNALVGLARTCVTRVSGGLSTWARRLAFEPFRLRVVGTAGSGKTQLALQVLNDAAASGQRALYVCFNRPLADHLQRLAPAKARVATFHMLGDERVRQQGGAPDFGDPGEFRRLAQALIDARPLPEELVDVLVVDEGQDFEQPWADALMRFLKPHGKAWWLEDPMQNLYGRAPVDLPAWTVLRAEANYRTPRDILQQIGWFMGGATGIQSASPVEGDGVEIVTYRDGFGSLRDATLSAIAQCREAGFRVTDMALLSYRGREGSSLMGFDRLGPHSLRCFDGRYDEAGRPLYRQGELLLETVFRFKGQSAPCVILTEVDFDTLDEQAVRRLYVAATRATMRFTLVMTERAAQVCVERMG
jgi:hypothetical protein